MPFLSFDAKVVTLICQVSPTQGIYIYLQRNGKKKSKKKPMQLTNTEIVNRRI